MQVAEVSVEVGAGHRRAPDARLPFSLRGLAAAYRTLQEDGPRKVDFGPLSDKMGIPIGGKFWRKIAPTAFAWGTPHKPQPRCTGCTGRQRHRAGAGIAEYLGEERWSLIERVAAFDVHKDLVVACVRVPGKRGRRTQEKRSFQATTAGLLVLRDWLRSYGVTVVGMESTGCYWKPVYYLLADEFECRLLNAQTCSASPGGRCLRRWCAARTIPRCWPSWRAGGCG